jgi:signal transduction histidine kinase
MSSSYSLKRRLLVWISVPVMIAGLVIAIMAFTFSWHEIEEVYDAQLVHSAKVLLQMTEHEILENGTISIQLGAENANLQHRYENKTGFRIWHNDALVTQSAHAAIFEAIEAPPGFSDQEVNGKPWRFFVFIDTDKNLRIETAERYAIRYELIGQLMISLIVPALLFIPMLLGVIWFGTHQSLKPLLRLSTTVDARHSDDLTPVSFDGIPREVLPLVAAMNRLFTRIGESFKREREFTDHAAHELRTPLAAMKTQTQVLMKKAALMPECSDGLDNLHATINRATRLIEQLLLMARLQNENIPLAPVDLSACLEGAVKELQSLSSDKHQTLTLAISQDVFIQGHYDSLSIMLRNVLDNAIKYTPDGGQISVSLTPEGILDIADTGPGLRDSDKERVFERFVRADKSGQSGSGLGLSITRWIADAHHAIITLRDNKPQGLIIHIEWNKA